MESQFDAHFFALEVGLYELPVDEGSECVEILGAVVAVVHVVGVFPDVNGQQWLVAHVERVFSVGGVDDEELLLLLGQPSPARPKVAQCVGRQLFRQPLRALPLRLDALQQLARGLGLERTDAVPVEGMVPVLRCVVVDLLVRALEYNFL